MEIKKKVRQVSYKIVYSSKHAKGFYENRVILLECPKCCHAVEIIREQSNDEIKFSKIYCPYCGKKLVKGK